jgi:flagellar biosynthetic protein FliR
VTITVAGEPLIAYLLASVRIVAWLAVVPPFSSRAVPAMAKVVLSLGLAFAITPAPVTSGAEGKIPVGFAELAVNVVTQVLVGSGMGFVTYLLFQAIASAGSLIDIFGGFALAQGFDPLGLTMNTVFGKFHQMLATMLLFASGAHLIVIGGLLRTFEFLPLGTGPKIGDPTDLLTTAFGMFFTTAVQIALPMIAVLFVADLGLALLTKVAPQLNAINVMFPAKIGLTLLLLGLSFPVLPEAMSRLVDLANQATATIAGAP